MRREVSALGAELLEALESSRGRELLLGIVRESVRAEIERSTGDELLDVDEAAQLLKTTPAALYQRVARGTVQVVRHGASLRFRRSDLVTTG